MQYAQALTVADPVSRRAIGSFDGHVENPGVEGPAVSLTQQTRPGFLESLSKLPLFRRSLIDWCLAQTVPLLTGLCRFRKPKVESTVVPQLSLWEKFLSHRCRRSRAMLFAVAFEESGIIAGEYIPAALAGLVRLVLESGDVWENQPLNVVVADRCRSQVIDPREPTGTRFTVAIVDEQGAAQQCQIDLQHAQSLTNEKLQAYVLVRLSQGEPVSGPVSAVFNCRATHPESLNAAYAEFPGAWLRVAPDATTGGLVASADHYVLDGAMFQDLLLRMAHDSARVNKIQSECEQSSEELAEPVARLRIDGVTSLTEVIKHVAATLQDFGIEVLNGRDTAILVTIPHAGPGVRHELKRACRRVLPLILNLEGAYSAGEIKSRIQDLNVNGWCSAGAQVWERLYCGNVFSWLVYFMERISPLTPFQRASRYLAGGALISCLPPVKHPEFNHRRVAHLSSRTISPPAGGPTITIMQVCSTISGSLPTAFITISGSRQWGRVLRLQRFRDCLAQRIGAAAALRRSADESLDPARAAG